MNHNFIRFTPSWLTEFNSAYSEGVAVLASQNFRRLDFLKKRRIPRTVTNLSDFIDSMRGNMTQRKNGRLILTHKGRSWKSMSNYMLQMSSLAHDALKEINLHLLIVGPSRLWDNLVIRLGIEDNKLVMLRVMNWSESCQGTYYFNALVRTDYATDQLAQFYASNATEA